MEQRITLISVDRVELADLTQARTKQSITWNESHIKMITQPEQLADFYFVMNDSFVVIVKSPQMEIIQLDSLDKTFSSRFFDLTTQIDEIYDRKN